MLTVATPSHNTAVVARTDPMSDQAAYLLVMPAGRPVWVQDPESATTFASMREAIRMASRLPASNRAYGLPREAELAVHRMH